MRKILAIYSLLVLSAIGCTGQSPRAQQSTKCIAAYIKVWGYLKYFHPDVTQGKVNWDSAFVADLKLAEDSATFPLSVEHLMLSAGGPKSYGMNPYHHDVLHLADLRWMDDSTLFGSQVRSDLHAVYSDLVPEETHYVRFTKNNNASFITEDSTLTEPYPDEAHRILAIARHWNAIEYFYPDLDLIPSWSDTLEAYLPRVLRARNTAEYQLTMLQYCCSIRDGHSVTSGLALRYALGEYYLPLPLTHIGRMLVFRKPRAVIDLPFRPGDILQSIGGESVGQIIQHYAPIVRSSNESSMMKNICSAISKRTTADSVEVTYETADKLLHSTMLKPLSLKPLSYMEQLKPIDTGGKSWTTLEGGIGYVNMEKLTPQEVARAMQVLSMKNAIIFDLRNYPQGTVGSLVYWLRAKGQWAEFRKPNGRCPGTFTTFAGGIAMPERERGIFSDYTYRGKVIVLVNDETQSHAEYTAMMLRSIAGSVFIGNQTAGADGDVSGLWLPGGIHTMFSGLGVFYPDGKPTQQVGIVPDVVVEPTITGIRAGRDEVLEKAIEVAKE